MADHGSIDHTGIPGVGGGGGFAQIVRVKRTAGDVTTTNATFQDVTSMTATLTTGATRCLVTFSAMGNAGSSTSTMSVDVAVDGTRQGGTYGLTSSGGDKQGNLSFSFWTDVLSAASHTIKVQFNNNAGTTSTIYASSVAPAIFTVAESNLTT